MKAINTLPDGYKEILTIDLQKNKKLALLVNGLGTLIAILMAVPMHFVVPVTTLFDMENGLIGYIIRMTSIILLIVVYMVLHELVHGISMKICGTKKIKYGFTGLYAFAGSEDYYAKLPYIFIALAPVVLWGVVLAIINISVPTSWFWVVYIIQIVNISGAAGDIFVTSKFSRLPKDVLVKDHGVGMVVYSKTDEVNFSFSDPINNANSSCPNAKKSSMKKFWKIILTVLSSLSFLLLSFFCSVYYFGGLSHLYYGRNVIISIFVFVAVAILVLALLMAIIVMMFKSKKAIRIVCIILLILFIPVSLYFSFMVSLGSMLFGPNGCSYTENIENYGKYDKENYIPHFPDSITDDMTVVDFAYFYKYVDVDQTDIYLEVKFDSKEVMDEYLTRAKESFSEKGFVTYQNPFDPKYTDIIEKRRALYSAQDGICSSYIFFDGDEDYKYVEMNYDSITYSYDELTIIYNETSIGSDIEVGNNPDNGEYYPKYLERFGVEWNLDKNFKYSIEE